MNRTPHNGNGGGRNVPLPGWLVEQLMRPPAFGRHQWLFVMALKLSRYRCQAETLNILSGAAARITRDVPERELTSTVENAARIHAENGGKPLSPAQRQAMEQRKWPAPCLHDIDRIVRGGPRQDEGRALSPVKFDPARRHTEDVIDQLYPPNPLLCVARRANWDVYTREREELRGLLSSCSLIVANPMSAPFGVTQDGRQSLRTLKNVGPRVYLPVEFDFTKCDEAGVPTLWTPLIEGWEAGGISVRDACMALIMHLAKSLVLVLIVYSGGKSLHGWFFIPDWPEARLHLWMREAVRLGACHSTWCAVQLVRMPDGTRYPGGQRQEILYFNADPILWL